MTPSLTKVQRTILAAMIAEPTGFAIFGVGTRKGLAVRPHAAGGIIFNAYQSPEYFLKNRGLIEICARNVPGYWYRVTDAGRAASVLVNR